VYSSDWRKEAGDELDEPLPAEACRLAAPPERREPEPLHLVEEPPQARVVMLDALKKINTQWIKAIDEYRFPVVTLSNETQPDALCTIFETLNRTGVKLSVFELLTARFWPQKINLRALWDKAREEYSILEDFDVDPYYVLQAISLACRKAPSCKRGDVLNLATIDIETWWGPVIAGLATGLDILREDCKVMLPKWVPCLLLLLHPATARGQYAAGRETRRSNVVSWRSHG